MATNISQRADQPAILATAPIDPAVDISDVAQLVGHLKQAAYVEMATIPLYLYAEFSIRSRGYSQWNPGIGAFRLIRSVVVEEMLHLCLVRNVLVALGRGDEITFYDQGFMPKYPSPLLHRCPPLELHLAPCSPKLAQDVFMEVERPDPKRGECTPPKGQYATIGELYKAIGKGLSRLDKEQGKRLWAHNEPGLQYVSAYWNNDGGGTPVVVTDLTSARVALKTIVEQGEGIKPGSPTVPIEPADPTPGANEMPHYTKFKQIADGIDPVGPTWPVPTDPHAAAYRDDEAITSINALFNAVYCYVLHMLDVLYVTSSEDMEPNVTSARYGYERTFISAMQGIMVSVAEVMVATPITKGKYAGAHHAGPTFEYYQLPPLGKKGHLIQLCDTAMRHFPALGGDNSVRWLLDKMPDI